jgi:hypothetical protein
MKNNAAKTILRGPKPSFDFVFLGLFNRRKND